MRFLGRLLFGILVFLSLFHPDKSGWANTNGDSPTLKLKPRFTAGDSIWIYSYPHSDFIYFGKRPSGKKSWQWNGYATSKDRALFDGLSNGQGNYYGVTRDTANGACDSVFSIQDAIPPRLVNLRFNDVDIKTNSIWLNANDVNSEKNYLFFTTNDGFANGLRGAGIASISITSKKDTIYSKDYFTPCKLNNIFALADSAVPDSAMFNIEKDSVFSIGFHVFDGAYSPYARYDTTSKEYEGCKLKSNVLDTTIALKVDTHAPMIILDPSFKGDSTYFGKSDFRFTFDDTWMGSLQFFSGIKNYKIRLNNETMENGSGSCSSTVTGNLPIPSNPDTLNLAFHVEDCAGNTKDTSIVFYFDKKKPVVSLNSPTKDSFIRADSILSIKWKASDDNKLSPNGSLSISIYYSPDGGKHTSPIAKNIKNTGQYTWQPDTTLKNCLWDSTNSNSAFYSDLIIQATDLANNVGSDTANFHLDGDDPDGEFVWPKESSVLKAERCDTIRIQLNDNYLLSIAPIKNYQFSSDSGGTWQEISSSNDSCFKFLSGENGIYKCLWTVPKVPDAKSTACFIKAVVGDSAGNKNNIFSKQFTVIQGMTLIFPRGGEYFKADSDTVIKWARPAPSIKTIKSYYRKNQQSDWRPTKPAPSGDASTGRASWHIPEIHSDRCQIKIEAYDAENHFVDSNSSSFFTVDSTRPKISELKIHSIINPDSLQKIFWEAGDNNGFTPDSLIKIDIQFSPNGGGNWCDVVRDTINKPPFEWHPMKTLTVCKNKGIIDDLHNLDLKNSKFKLTAKDLAHNFSFRIVSFCVDGQPPSAGFDRPSKGDTLYAGACDTLSLINMTDNCSSLLTNYFYYSFGDSNHWQSIPISSDTCYKNLGGSKWLWKVPDTSFVGGSSIKVLFIKALLRDSVGNDTSIIVRTVYLPKWQGVVATIPDSGSCVRWQNTDNDSIKIRFRESARPKESWDKSVSIQNRFTWEEISVPKDSFNYVDSTLSIYLNIKEIGLYRVVLNDYERQRDNAEGKRYQFDFYNLLEPNSEGTITKKIAPSSHNSFGLSIRKNKFDFPTKFDFQVGSLGKLSNVNFADSTFWTTKISRANEGDDFSQAVEVAPGEMAAIKDFSIAITSTIINNDNRYHIFGSPDAENWTIVPETFPSGQTITLSSHSEYSLSPYYAVGTIEIAEPLINYPNPFNPLLETTTIYINDISGLKEVVIYDAFGNLVRKLKVNSNFVLWDGRNEQKKVVANGVYFCRVKGEIRKIAVSKNK